MIYSELTVIRSLAPDELTWFLSRYYTFLGHSDPRGFAKRVLEHARDLDHESVRTFINLDEANRPKAGLNLLAPDQDADDQNLYLSNLWFEDDPADLRHLIKTMLARHHHEAAHAPLYNFSEATVERLETAFEGLGFELEGAFDLAFSLSDLPPLGRPLVLEAWSHSTDGAFRDLFEGAEARSVSDAMWAWLKRWRGRFLPKLWFMVRETLDQPPVGYAFYGAEREGIDGVYYLSAVGVLQEHRHSTEMLKRVVLSSLHELAAISPLGRVETTLSADDPKLIRIFELLGFDTFNRYKRFIRRPD